jgi:uncharacterized membrane protein YoaK (UPF0700 family)
MRKNNSKFSSLIKNPQNVSFLVSIIILIIIGIVDNNLANFLKLIIIAFIFGLLIKMVIYRW